MIFLKFTQICSKLVSFPHTNAEPERLENKNYRKNSTFHSFILFF